MDPIHLERTLDDLSKIIAIDEVKKKELFSKYCSMTDTEIIKELSQIFYRVLGSNQDLYNYALTVIRNINPEICPPIEEMKVMLSKLFLNEIEGNMTLQENHKLVSESLVKFTNLFNEYGIDYYIVGALPCFLKIGQPLFRYHDDIDIMVNEEDIPKIAEIIKLNGYIFYDDRFPSLERFYDIEANKPPHTVLAQNPNNEFHLGFFTFKREQDNSITMREYSHRIDNGEVAVDVLERRLDQIGTSLRYDEIPTTYLETSFKTSTIESVYNLKAYTKRPKDITDMQKLEPFIDKKKLTQLSAHPSFNVKISSIAKLQGTHKKNRIIKFLNRLIVKS